MLRLVLVAADHRLAEHLDLAGERRLQADDRAHQHRFAGARSADHAEHLAAPDVEIEPVMDDLVAEAVLQAADADDRLVVVGGHQFKPIAVKKTAKKASRTMTRKMPWTTAVVVRRPTSSAFPFDLQALIAAGHRDDHAEHRRLDQRLPEIGHRHDLADALDEGDRRDVERRPSRRCRRRRSRRIAA